MTRIELDDFYNAGFGWICRRCELELKESANSSAAASPTHSRLLREGESESKEPRLSSAALAKWFDAAQTTLICPRCGLTEAVDGF